jgi:hypothetical protein
MGRKKKNQGLGDLVEDVLNSPVISPLTKKVKEIFINGDDCGCEERKQLLNNLFPFKSGVKCLTEEQYNIINKLEIGYIVDYKTKSIIEELHSDIFNHQLNRLCSNCGSTGKIIKEWYDDLKKLSNSYKEE